MTQSELHSRAQELRSLASKCRTILDLSRSLGRSMEIARHANAELQLGLPEAGIREPGPRVAGVSVPKPTKKGAGK